MSGESRTDVFSEPWPDGEQPGTSRPWTPAAAMEPLPPLAPPPSRPLGSVVRPPTGRAVESHSAGRHLSRALWVAGLAALAVLLAVLLALALLAGR